jgi:arabinofuranan 3-O-arabinosyltransferase
MTPSAPALDPAQAAPRPAPARALAWLDRRAALIPAVFVLAALADDVLSRTRVGPDFEVYHRAAVRFLAGEPLYRLAVGHMCWKYSPAAAAVLAPLGLLPARAAQIAFNVASAAALLAWFRWAARRPWADAGAFGQLAATLCAMPSYTLLFFFGQADALLLALALGSELCAEERPALSGLLWAVAVLFKPPLLLLGVVAALSREGRRIGWAALAGLSLSALAALPYGLAGGLAEVRAWRELLAATTPPLLCHPANQGAFGIACRWAGLPGSPAFAVALAALGAGSAAALGAAAWRAWRRDAAAGRALAFAGAVYLAALLSPLGWTVNLLAAVPFAFAASALVRRGRGAARLVSAAALAAAAGSNLVADRLIGHDAAQALIVGRYRGLSALALVIAAAAGAAGLLAPRPPSAPGVLRT